MNKKFYIKQYILVVLSTIGFGLFAIAAPATLEEDSMAYWRPYQPGQYTLALYQFDDVANPLADLSGKSAKLVLPEGVEVSKEGRFGNGLRFGPGHDGLSIRLGESLFDQGCFIVDFWLKAERLPEPGKKATLLFKPHVHRKSNGFHLYVTSDGSIAWDNLTLHAESKEKSPDLFAAMSSGPGTVKLGHWQHVGVVIGKAYTDLPNGYLSVDGVLLDTATYAGYFINYGIKEEGVTELMIGSSPEQDDSFNGSIDQLRIVSGMARLFYPIPDESFLDPKAQRRLRDDPAFFAGATDIVFKLSFEDTLRADVAGGNSAPVSQPKSPPVFVPGVRGKALFTPSGYVEGPLYACQGNLDAQKGALEMWIKPVNWGSPQVGHLFFMRCQPGDGPSFCKAYTSYIWGFIGNFLWVGGVEGGNGEYRADTWMHFVFNWLGRHAWVYVNGAEAFNCVLPQPFAPPPANAHFGTPWGQAVAVDEYVIYRRPLAAAEVKNHYQRYFPDRSYERVRSVELKYTFLQGVGKVTGMIFERTPAIATPAFARIRLTQSGFLGRRSNLTQQTLPYSRDQGAGFILEGIPVPLEKGTYYLQAELLDQKEKPIVSEEIPFKFKQYPWLGNKIGISDKVLKPWTAIKVKHPAARVSAEPTGKAGSRGAAYSAVAKPLAAKAGSLRNPPEPRTPFLPVATCPHPEREAPREALRGPRASWRRRVNDRDIEVIGRIHRLSDGGLFQQIENQGKPMFTKSMRLEGASGGKPFVFTDLGVKMLERKDTEVKWQGRIRGQANDNALAITVTARMEYDGHTEFTFEFEPEGHKPLTIDRLSLILPIRSEYAGMYQMYFDIMKEGQGCLPKFGRFRAGNGLLFSSKVWYEYVGTNQLFNQAVFAEDGEALKIDGAQQEDKKLIRRWKPTVGNFIPQLWVGNEYQGLSYMADSDAGWAPDDGKPAITLERNGETVEWRFNFVSNPLELKAPRTVVVSFQATPEKPLPANWRKHFFGIAGQPGFKLDNGAVVNQLLGQQAGWDEETGVSGFKPNPELATRVVNQLHAAGFKVTPHAFLQIFSWGGNTAHEFEAEWNSNGGPEYSLYTRSRIDYGIWSIQRWKDKYGIDGLYYDLAHPAPNLNTISGTAYLLLDGRTQPGWMMFGQREFFKRAAHVFGDVGEQCFTWGCVYYGPQICGWQFAAVHGGEMNITTSTPNYPGNFDFMSLLPNSGKFGTILLYMRPDCNAIRFKDSDAYTRLVRHMYAMMLPLDLLRADVNGGALYPQCFYDFGIADPDAQFMWYWANPYVSYRCAADHIYTSLWLKKNQKVVVIVSNLGETDNQLKLAIDLAAMGLKGEKVQVLDGERSVVVKPNEDKLAWYWRMQTGGRAIMPEGREEMRKINSIVDGGTVEINMLVPRHDYRLLEIISNPDANQ